MKNIHLYSLIKGGMVSFLILITLLISSCNPKNEGSDAEAVTPRDLNKNGRIDAYEDPGVAVDLRVEDLLSQMSVKEKAGLLFIPVVRGDIKLGDSLVSKHFINHLDMLEGDSAIALVNFNNHMQKIAENTRLGIPITFCSDPRHGKARNEGSGPKRFYSYWPSQLGLAAINDADLVREFGDIARQELKATGIRLALHPMADLGTEPRWFRVNGTFGEDAEISAKLTKAYVLGFQGDTLNSQSVACMTKHFPGGGPQKDGWDAHFATGKEQVYPGGNFDYHLIPFTEGALAAHTAQMMIYYGQPIGVTEEEVAFAFDKSIVTDLLRDSLGFEGVISTDWGLITDSFAKEASAWGVEDLSHKERALKIMEAGCDMFGGEGRPDLIIDLVNEGSLSEERLNASVRRILKDKFILGLFDDPYLDESDLVVFHNETFQEKGRAAQRKSLVLLKNEERTLPLAKNTKVFVQGMDAGAFAAYAEVVATPEDADVILLKFNAPYTPATEGRFLEKLFHQGRLDLPQEDKETMLKLILKKPTVTILTLDRPSIVPEINQASKAVIADFECQDEILAELIFGDFTPTGRMPIELPSSVEAAENQLEDVPYDSKDPLYSFGHGLSYE